MANLDDYSFMKEKKYSFIRAIWSFIYIILIVLTVGLIITLWREFLVNPTVTTLETTYHPVKQIPFPGVAICNMNKISKKSATFFAEYIANNSEMSKSEMLNVMPIFGKLYDFDYNSGDDKYIAKVQSVLEKMQLNIINIMETLSSRCDNLLVRCRWKGVKTNCSDIFTPRMTYNGPCCTFNYIKETNHRPKSIKKNRSTRGEAGVNRGLSVVINNEIEDYLYTPLNSQGVTVQVFVPTDYPDKLSGSLTEVMAKVETENFLEIVPTTVQAVKEVISYPLARRQCLFDEERSTKFRGVYSQSDCNVDCRVTSALALCQCIPFMIPLSTKDSVCTLTDLPCLSRYKNKWNSLYPDTDNLGLLQREQHDSLHCSQRCYPSCDSISYEVRADRAHIHSHDEGKHSLIHIYYGKRFSNLYKQDVVYYWFEILSNFGGTFGLVIGLSLISIIECLIFSFQLLEKKRRP